MSAGPLPEPEARYIPTPDNLSDSHGELVVTRFVDLGVEVEEITLVGKLSTVQKEDLQAKAQVESLLRGDWIEFMPGTDEAYRCLLYTSRCV